MEDLGEEFTIKFVDDFCNVERSVQSCRPDVLLVAQSTVSEH